MAQPTPKRDQLATQDTSCIAAVASLRVDAGGCRASRSRVADGLEVLSPRIDERMRLLTAHDIERIPGASHRYEELRGCQCLRVGAFVSPKRAGGREWPRTVGHTEQKDDLVSPG